MSYETKQRPQTVVKTSTVLPVFFSLLFYKPSLAFKLSLRCSTCLQWETFTLLCLKLLDKLLFSTKWLAVEELLTNVSEDCKSSNDDCVKREDGLKVTLLTSSVTSLLHSVRFCSSSSCFTFPFAPTICFLSSVILQ